MLVRKWRSKPDVVTITVTIASVKNHKPIIGFTDEVEKSWRSLQKKHQLKEKKIGDKGLLKSSSSDLLDDHVQTTVSAEKLSKSTSDIGRVMLKFREMEKQEEDGRKDDVYSKNFTPKKYQKGSAEYGTPKPGTLTEKRAQKASKHIAREMLYLCEVMQEYGYVSKRTGKVQITFGRLFNVYQFISDKVVGMLLRARKHNMVDFEGEMLFQRRDEEVVITLLLTTEEIKYAYDNLK
ncbi:unnamed protein product [Auanema sp. JU1783]|nr:unnamed protein product [Auanema sp. JU1783]